MEIDFQETDDGGIMVALDDGEGGELTLVFGKNRSVHYVVEIGVGDPDPKPWFCSIAGTLSLPLLPLPEKESE